MSDDDQICLLGQQDIFVPTSLSEIVFVVSPVLFLFIIGAEPALTAGSGFFGMCPPRIVGPNPD